MGDYFLVSKLIKPGQSGKRPVRLWKCACSVLFPKLSGTDVNYTSIRHCRVLSKHYPSCLLKKLGGMFTLLSCVCNKAFLSWEKHRAEVRMQNYLILNFLQFLYRRVTSACYWQILEDSFPFHTISIEEVGKENITC